MKKVTLVKTVPEAQGPGFAIAGAAVAGTLLVIPALLLTLVHAGAGLFRSGQRLAAGKGPGNPAPRPRRISNVH